jgi:hypothetical protein
MMFFKKKQKEKYEIDHSQEYMTNRKIVGSIEPYIADMQQDIQGVLARHNDLVRKVEGMQIIIDELETQHASNEDIMKQVSKLVDITDYIQTRLRLLREKNG